MKHQTSIGVEIEVNNLTSELYDTVDWSIWKRDSEHCGVELRSSPCKGPRQIRRLVESIKNFEGNTQSVGFHNAGTHIHYDFLNMGVSSIERLRRHSSRKVNGRWQNPFGNARRWFWTDSRGYRWESPASYRAANGITSNKAAANVNTPPVILNAVKRFMCLGIRFAEPLLCLQHPDRRVNKYCHTIGDWDENLVIGARSVEAIANGAKLGQNHRRLMINPLSFAKWGTIEVRMIKASIDADEIWDQIFLFGKMVALAKSNEAIPQPVGRISLDFGTLLDAADIHGRIRRRLTQAFRNNYNQKQFNCICYNFNCLRYGRHEEFVDYGLSRMVCKSCNKTMTWCAICGAETLRKKTYLIDDKIDGGRYMCAGCAPYNNVDSILFNENIQGCLRSMGTPVGTGFDEDGFKTLRKMHGIFA